jgi:hypothetical protein
MNYKPESLGHLEAYITDALNSEASSKDVYDTIVNTIKGEIEYHKKCLERSQDLLLMLKGNLSEIDGDPWNNFSSAEEGSKWVEENGGYEYTP